MTQPTATSAVVDFISARGWPNFPPTRGDRQALYHRRPGRHARRIHDRASRILREYVRGSDLARRPRCSAKAFRTSAASAALANGASGHALDFDDTQLSTTPDRIFGLLTHPTIPPLAAALAVGERQRRRARSSSRRFSPASKWSARSPRRSIRITTRRDFTRPARSARSARRSPRPSCSARRASDGARARDCGEHGVGHPRELRDDDQAAARRPGGAERRHRRRAGGEGVHRRRDALDRPWGFFRVFSFGDGFDADRIVGVLGNPYTIVSPGVSIKPYPCGVLGHPSMDAMRKLVIDARRAARADRGDSPACRLEHPQPAALPGRARASSRRSSARPSCWRPSRSAARPGSTSSPTSSCAARRCRQMMAKVERVLDPEIEARGFEKIRSTVEVDLADGRTLVEHADERYRGGPDRPFTREELHEKFTECAAWCCRRRRRRDVRDGRVARDLSDISDARAQRSPSTARRSAGAPDEPGLDLGRRARAGRDLSCTTTINVGVLSLALALLVGVVSRRHVARRGARRVSGRAVHHARRGDAALQHRRSATARWRG